MPPWVIVLLLSGAALTFGWALMLVHDSGTRGRTLKYRDLFERLILDLEQIVGRANRLHSLAEKTKDGVLLDHYHSAIKMIETLLVAVKKLHAYGEDVDLLQAPNFLVKDIDQRLGKIETAFQKSLLGKPHEFMKTAPAMSHTVIGCHFCSRPFEAHLFGKVRVKIDGKSEDVASCKFCREKLLSTRKARVLFFTEDGDQVHWSKAKSWTPKPEYWNINRADADENKKAPHLELVYSQVSRIKPLDNGSKP
jgi:hypothetical protein